MVVSPSLQAVRVLFGAFFYLPLSRFKFSSDIVFFRENTLDQISLFLSRLALISAKRTRRLIQRFVVPFSSPRAHSDPAVPLSSFLLDAVSFNCSALYAVTTKMYKLARTDAVFLRVFSRLAVYNCQSFTRVNFPVLETSQICQSIKESL